ncbi:MAG: phosphoenolpyruvate carboxykinase (GTP) [Planctomycetes bacterium]|nr:phosphoenolpyruvate carboxykinase (GTP) [Planctomycetota bacterium]
MNNVNELLKEKLTTENYNRLTALDNPKMHDFVADAIELAGPASVFVCTDSEEDRAYIRELAIKNGEEIPLNTPGHTCHFDGYRDQARDKAQTKYLLPSGSDLGASLNSIEKKVGVEEVRSFLKDSMVGREMLVCFFCLGPIDSDFSIPCIQITDSPYAAHSETILYRPGYEQFRKTGSSGDFFRFIHSEGVMENKVSKDIDKRRIYIDLEENLVYSVNTQYGGNTIGLKKLALRLAIQKASAEGWLAEHMFILGAHGPGGRVTYFAGAFPSACGKTSTSMLPGQTIVGDDIAYFRKKDGQIRCVNVEKGIFGIIRDVNSKDDPIIYDALTGPCEVIFSNVLIDGAKKPHWLGMGAELPTEGTNHSGKWHKGKTDSNGNEITPSHKNARYCLNIPDLSNRDPLLDDPNGVPVGGVIYGGRDSDTLVPVEQAFNWAEGIIIKGACLESETTAATLGKEGVRTFNLMSNLDFLSIPLGRYIQNNLDFANGIENPPLIFLVNYFLKDKDGKYLNGMADKLVWILWAELRVNGDVEAIETPTGLIPKYEDLEKLFKEHLDAQYTQADYVEQFAIRIPKNLAKLDRVEKIYKEKVSDTPQIVFDTFAEVRKRMKAAGGKHGDYISPFDLETI